MSEQRKTIRFEDLGEPVQKLIKSVKGGVSDDDMALLEYVSVKDMAKIYGEMSSDRQAELIWQELKNALEARKQKAEEKERLLREREQELNDAQKAAAEDDEEERARLEAEAEEEARRKRKAEKRKRKMEEKIAAAEAEEARLAAEQEAAEAEERARQEEEERLAAEEAERKKREKKKKKREAKLRELEAEQEAMRLEAEKKKKSKKRQADEWKDYVDSHPLEFAEAEPEIKQVEIERTGPARPPPSATEELLNRSYTPKCPNCSAKFSKPPPEWDCPMCLRRLRKRFKVWQPDEDSESCMKCKTGIGRFSRHHCRNCGRLICGNCLTGKALIAHLGYKDSPVKVCSDCVTNIPEDERALAEGQKNAAPSPSPEKTDK